MRTCRLGQLDKPSASSLPLHYPWRACSKKGKASWVSSSLCHLKQQLSLRSPFLQPPLCGSGGYVKAAAPIPSWPIWLMDLLRPVGSLGALLLPVPPFHPVTPALRREGGREPRAGAERQRCARRHVKISWTTLPDCKFLLGVCDPSSFSLCKGRGCAQGAAEPLGFVLWDVRDGAAASPAAC